jgi:hypothetical protein
MTALQMTAPEKSVMDGGAGGKVEEVVSGAEAAKARVQLNNSFHIATFP